MKILTNELTKLIRDEQGASATEYSVLIALIILVALGSIQLLGIQVVQAFVDFVALFQETAASS